MRRRQGKFAPGSSGNPGGRPKKLREIDEEIQRDWAPRAVDVIKRLYALAMSPRPDETTVPAAREFLNRVIGKASTLPRERHAAVEVPPLESVLELRERLLSVVHREAAGLEVVARERSLTAEEAGVLSGYLRVLAADKPENMTDAELRRLMGLDAAGVASKG